MAAMRTAGKRPNAKASGWGAATVTAGGAGGGATATHSEQSSRCKVGASELSALLDQGVPA